MPADQRDTLLEALGIGRDDLAANRTGRLGSTQVRQLIRSGWNNILMALVLGVALAAILAGVAQKPLRPVQWILATALFGAALAAGIVHARKARSAAADGRVERLSGPVEVRSRGRAGWFLEVAGRSFRLPVRPWHVTNGAAYHVYVAPRAGMIVGMEPVEAPPR